MLWFFLAGAVPAQAAAAGVTVTVAPGSVTLRPGDAVDIGLLVTNDTAAPIAVSSIDVAPRARIGTLVIPPTLPAVLPVGASLQATLRVSTGTSVEDGDLVVLVRTQGAAGATRLNTATLAVKAGSAMIAPTVDLVGFPDQLEDGQGRVARVQVTNKTSVTLLRVGVAALPTGDLALSAVTPAPTDPCGPLPSPSATALACIDRVTPGQSVLVDITVSAASSVRTGKQTVGVVVSGTPEPPPSVGAPATADAPATAVVVATTTVELTVFGIDALSPFGIGTLFVFPGVVAVLVFLLLAQVYPRATGLPETIGLGDLRALPVVVPVAALAYLIVWLVWGQNLTRSVSTAAVAALFGVGFVLGALSWIALAGTWWYRIGRKQFTVDDDPADVLARLRARGRTLILPRFVRNGVRHCYLGPAEGGRVLAMPCITYTFTESMADAAHADGRREFVRAVDRGDIDGVLAASRRDDVLLGFAAAYGVVLLDGADVQAGGSGPVLEELVH